MKKSLYILLLCILVPAISAETSTVRGIVLDSLDNLVGYADIKLDCIEGKTFSTDKFGTFTIKDVPAGTCKIYATYGDAIGFETFNIELNQTSDVEVALDKTIINVSKEEDYTWLIMAVLLIFIVLYFKSRRKLEKKVKAKARKVKEPRNDRIADILKTLNYKEQQITNLLLENKSKMYQAKIRHELGIPRTTLSRILQSLEKKNIIGIQKSGKVVKINLTKWFLGNK